MLLQPVTLLLFGAAWAQQPGAYPSIEDMLHDSSQSGQSIPVPSGVQPILPAVGTSTYDNSVGQAQASLGAATSDAGQSVGQQLGAGSPAPGLAPVTPPGGALPGAADPMKGLSGMSSGGKTASSGDKNMDKKLDVMMDTMQQQMGIGPKGKKDMFGRRPGDASVKGGLHPEPQAGSGAAAATPAGGGGGGLFGGLSNNPIMGELLSSVEAKMPANQKIAMDNGAEAPISQESHDIVAGIVEAFMHKVKLAPGEKSCLEHNLATVTADVVGTTEDIIKGVKAIIAGHDNKTAQGVSAAAQGTLVSAGMDGSMKLTSLVTLATTLMKNCVKGDALAMLKETGEHFIDMKYLGHRFLVSGVDIAHRLSDAIVAYERKDWHRFGADIGTSIRKILLSNSTRGSRLPEGVPEEAIIQETTEGLMGGFFRSGTGVEITDSAAPDVDIQLDLHRCIAGNHEFFKEVWLAMWNLIAELSVQVGNHDFKNPFSDSNADGSQPKWMGEIMVAMMQVPMALSRCNIDADTQEMMMQAIKSIKYLKVHFLFPQHMITADEATKRMAMAIQSWTNWDFKGFGTQIGKLLREFVLMMYPQQYSVDASGRLRRQLIGASAATKAVKVAGTSSRALIVGGAASSMLVALVAVRGFRSASRDRDQELVVYDDDLEVSAELLEIE